MGIDANFWMMNLLQSDNLTDPGLHTGLAYFMESEKYKTHVAAYATQKDVCVSVDLCTQLVSD